MSPSERNATGAPDQPERGYDVAIVGSGFSAIALAMNLLRVLRPPVSIAIVGDDPGFGRGTAYRTDLRVHRLNVAAARMSVYADEPDDFLGWLGSRYGSVSPDGYAARTDYGLYLRDRMAAALRDRGKAFQVDFIKAKAASCGVPGPPTFGFTLDNGDRLHAANVVLALGVGSADIPVAGGRIDEQAEQRIIRNPWRLNWLSRVRSADTVLMLGSGLTMIDQVLALFARGHEGKVHVLSRRGLVSHSHATSKLSAVTPVFPESREISALLASLRAQARKTNDWRSLMDGLRPLTQILWQQLDAEQRLRFLRHALPWWNIHRHRLAPAVHRHFEALRKADTVSVHAGKLGAIRSSPTGVMVEYRERGTRIEKELLVDWIVNCTGMERSGLAQSPLLNSMIELGLIVPDNLGLGVAVDETSRVVGADGIANAGLMAVGQLTAGRFWEITAVPDIRVQARDIACAIASRL